MRTDYMVKYYSSDASVSLERAEDSISILDLAKDSEVSVLIPHSDASAYNTMVSPRPYSSGGHTLMIRIKANYHSSDI
jgi:hypothetical protein